MDEIKYKYGDDEITVWEDNFGTIHVYEDEMSMEVEFYHSEAEKALEVLKNIHKFLLNNQTCRYIDTASYEGEDDDGDPNDEWYWNDSIMENGDINPYFLPADSFSGNCLYREQLPYMIESIQEYFNPKDISNIDNLTLRSVLRLKRNLANDN